MPNVFSLPIISIRSTERVLQRLPGAIHLYLPDKIILNHTTAHACIYNNASVCACTNSFPLQHNMSLDIPEVCLPHHGAFWFMTRVFQDESARTFTTQPFLVPFEKTDIKKSDITLVLLLKLSDVARAEFLIFSLFQNHHRSGKVPVHEMIMVCPDEEVGQIFEHLSMNSAASRLPFRTMIVRESILLGPTNSSRLEQIQQFSGKTYGLQMMLKLLVAEYIHTNYYITLDADVVLLRPLSSELIISKTNRAFFEPESRHVHLHWWKDSTRLLGLDQFDANAQGFGVTPAILSTYGSMAVLHGLRERFQHIATPNSFAEKWISSFGMSPLLRWTEYTIYRLGLDHFQLFEILHEPQKPESNLQCHSVWTVKDLPWDIVGAKDRGCIFSVIQSTAVRGYASLADLRHQFSIFIESRENKNLNLEG